MIRSFVCIALLIGAPLGLRAQTFSSVPALLDSLQRSAALADPTERDAALDALWADLRAADRIPFVAGDSAMWLWRGNASTVTVAGDHTRWNPSVAPLTRLGESDLWARADRFPEAARLDYKLVVGGSWILDPNNPHQQWSGFGPNSELRMPGWVFPEETVRQPGVSSGTLSPNVTITSAHVGTPVVYRVHTPAGYGAMDDLPVVYVTDGHEYADDRLGALRIVLDNLVAAGEMEPALVVFVDPRFSGTNRRQEQYIQNQGFARFMAEDLVPAIDAAYRTRTDRDSRVILGTSLGGLFSAYLGLRHPDVFGRLAIQSPAFWVSENPSAWTGPSIYQQVQASPDTWQIHMTTGTIHDTEAGARRMRDVMTARGLDVTYREVPEGHSWGNWRALLDEAFRTLLPPRASTETEAVTPEVPVLRLGVFPNPARAFVTFEVDGSPLPVRVACVDSLGREVLAVTTAARGEAHAVRVTTDGLAPGVYACTATAGGVRHTRSLTVAR
ncbi:MAG: alpha/beta hydrolase-fold protein [Bacteroidota bacterium]